jgi:flavin-dependent dehydrogenase
MADLQKAFLASRPELKARFAQARPLGGRRGTSMLLQTTPRWAERGVLHIGSSAFCVNPITGLGVGNAMSMGKLAAEQIRELYGQPDLSLQIQSAYEKKARKKYRNILLMNRLVNLIQRHFTFFEPLLARLLNTHLVQRLLVQPDLVKSFSRRKFYRKLSRS